jgi:DNA-binding transcriptional MerR regulator/effector-binding domain-containing protein
MDKCLSVGEVAKLFKLRSSTLRYYDEIGLFQPKYTDPETQYRYYTVSQFIVLDTIIFLRKNGFSIKDIKHQLDQRTPENTLDLLNRKLEEVREESKRLERIKAKMENKISLIKEGLELCIEPKLNYRYYPKRKISYLYYDKPIDLLNFDDDLYLKDLEMFTSKSLEYDGFFTGDIGTMVDINSLEEEGPVKYKAVFELLYDDKKGVREGNLNDGCYACYPYKGSYDSIKDGYYFVLNRIKEDGYEVKGAPIEIALLDESVIKYSEQYVTLIQVPVVKVKNN